MSEKKIFVQNTAHIPERVSGDQRLLTNALWNFRQIKALCVCICTRIRVYLGMSMYVYLRGGSPGGVSFSHNATLFFAALANMFVCVTT